MIDYDFEVPADIADTRPAAWVFADGHADTRLVEAASAARLRVTVRETAEAGLDRLVTGRAPVIAMVDVADRPRAAEIRLLERLDAFAADQAYPLIVSCAIEALDDVAACVAAPYATLLCGPSLGDRIAAIEVARAQTADFRDNVSEDALRLQRFADEVARIAQALKAMSIGDMAPTTVSDGLIGYRATPEPPRGSAPVTVRADDIRAMVRLRRQRDRILRGDYFADPAWDMILDLMIARIERLHVAVSSLCIAAAVPATTALRWIKTLTDAGVFIRVADPTDKRRIFIELADEPARAVLDLLGDAKRAGVAMI